MKAALVQLAEPVVPVAWVVLAQLPEPVVKAAWAAWAALGQPVAWVAQAVRPSNVPMTLTASMAAAVKPAHVSQQLWRRY